MAIKTVSLNKLPNAFHVETVLKTLERVGASNVPQHNAGVRPLFEDLAAKGIPEEAMRPLRLLTRDPEVPYMDYI